MKKAVIYARYSSERQTEQSIEGQLRSCNEYAERNYFLIMDTYIDRATTGTNDNRKEFQRLLKDSEKMSWEFVLIYKIDRFSRNKYEMAMHRKTLRDNNIKLISVMENIPDTPEGIILESLLEGMAEYYSAELSQKVKRGLNESRLKGNFTGGFMIYGYKVENKKVVIDEDKASVVRYIYQRYSEGAYVKTIIAELTEKGILNKGKPFARNTVYKILANPKYAGIYKYNNQIFTDIYPQIISPEVFEKIQTAILNNKYAKRDETKPYLLKNRLICGYCGKSIIAEAGTSRNKTVHKYYKCSSLKRILSDCQKTVVRKDIIEDTVLITTLELIGDDKTTEFLVQKILEERSKREADKSILNLLLEEQTQTQKSLDNIISAIEKGITSKSTQKRLDELEGKLEVLDQKIEIEKYKQHRVVTKNEIKKFLKYAIQNKPKTLIDLLINKVILYNDKIEIYYNYTDKIDPDEISQGLNFLYKTFNIKNESLFSFNQDCQINCYF